MTSLTFVKRIKNYAVISFVIPLIAINACLFFYKFVGNLTVKPFPDLQWEQNIQYNSYKEYEVEVSKPYTFINCPKYQFYYLYTNLDGQTIRLDEEQGDLSDEAFKKDNKAIENMKKNNNAKSIKRIYKEKLEDKCVRNHKTLYFLFTKFSWFEKIILKTIPSKEKGFSLGFAKVKNPYLYGEVSISRTARYFPATFIFKPLIILSALFLFLYWKNNLNLFRELKNKKILNDFTKKFFYFGLFSCIFLTLHALFLGLDIESKLFTKARRAIIVSFILFEVIAQILLTKNLFNFRDELKEYINPLILKIKIIFVTVVFITTCIAFSVLSFGDPSTAFKHTLEWNYFAFLLLYYLLSRLLWTGPKNQKF